MQQSEINFIQIDANHGLRAADAISFRGGRGKGSKQFDAIIEIKSHRLSWRCFLSVETLGNWFQNRAGKRILKMLWGGGSCWDGFM